MIIKCNECKSTDVEIFESIGTLKQEETVSPTEWHRKKRELGLMTNICIGDHVPQISRILRCKNCEKVWYDRGG